MEITYVLLYILIGVVSIILYHLRRTMNYWKDRGIAHEEPHFMSGNCRGVLKTRLRQDAYIEIYEKFKGTGPFCGFYFFQRPMAFILDTKLAKNILIKDFSNFADRGVFYNERDDPLSAHLFALDGVKWKQLRQRLSPTFTSGKMKFMFPTIVQVSEQFAQVFGEYVDRSDIVEIKELLARFTTDIIGTCAFGIECNSLKDPSAEFRLMGRTVFDTKRHGLLLQAFMFSFPKLARKLGMRQTPTNVHEFFMRIVRETVAMREQGNIKRSDFMDLLIELKNADNGSITIEELAAQAFVFFLAGFETSSTTMGYALYELARNPDIQDKVRAEINAMYTKHDQKLSYECMSELKYMDQVISETLRLYTIVSELFRLATNDYVVPGSPKFVIEKGTPILIPAAAYHHDPELYPEPHKFDPDRFTDEMVANRDAAQWLGFGDGPRNCIGLRFGKMQTRIGLTYLLKNFKFSVCDQTPIPLAYKPNGDVLTAIGGINLKVERI